ncbi:GntR family transcriptional regulator [Gordonia asplenii]|uniref:GntR family transcriptional regulator n=1 Tax=Gordonia asplenii TaxID=2725283 RepID=UPI0028AF9132|nr:GntR family transcriptional regulator [Gordonia asplenii]
MTSPEPRIAVDAHDPTPAFEQIRRQIVGHVAAGRLPIGSKLPPLRQLARDLGVAVGTAAHAYRLLEQSGVITTRRGAGTRVSAVPDAEGPSSELEQRVRALAAEYLAAVTRLGASPTMALDAVIRASQDVPAGP